MYKFMALNIADMALGCCFSNRKEEDFQTILDLPPEIIVKIFNWLPNKDIYGSVSQVCQAFGDIVKKNFSSVDLDLSKDPYGLETLEQSLINGQSRITKLRISINDNGVVMQPDSLWSILTHCQSTLRSLSLLGKAAFLLDDVQSIRQDFAAALGSLTNLEYLTLDWDYLVLTTPISSKDNKIQKTLASFKNLKSIRLLECNSYTLESLLAEAPADCLETLQMSRFQGNPLGELELRNLDRFKHLTHLTVPQFTPQFWFCLLKMESLTVLELLFDMTGNTDSASQALLSKEFEEQLTERRPVLAKVKTLRICLSNHWLHEFMYKLSMLSQFWSLFPNVQTLSVRQGNLHGVLGLLDYLNVWARMFPRLENLDLPGWILEDELGSIMNIQLNQGPAPPMDLLGALKSIRIDLWMKSTQEVLMDQIQKLPALAVLEILDWQRNGETVEGYVNVTGIYNQDLNNQVRWDCPGISTSSSDDPIFGRALPAILNAMSQGRDNVEIIKGAVKKLLE